MSSVRRRDDPRVVLGDQFRAVRLQLNANQSIHVLATPLAAATAKVAKDLSIKSRSLLLSPIAVASVCASPFGSVAASSPPPLPWPIQAGSFGAFSPMTRSRAIENLPSSLHLATAPYIPPVTSDVVIDLSHWQAPVDFARAKSAGIAAVILKATQGSHWIDATFAQRLGRQRPPPGCSSGPIIFSIIPRRSSKSRTSCRWRKAVPCSRSMPSRTISAAL